MSNTRKAWTPEEKERFRDMCLAGASNKELADVFGCSIFAVQHKRSTWGLTIEKCAAIAAGLSPIVEVPAPPEPTLSERGKEPDEENVADLHEETITIDMVQTFFDLADKLSKNAEAMKKLKTDNLALKTQLLNQSQIIAQLQDTVESLQIATEQICDHVTDIEDESNNKSDFMARSGLSRLFRRYKPLMRLGDEDPEMKEAEDGGND